MTKHKLRTNSRGGKGPVRMLQSELLDLQRDLRATLRAYASRLEIQLAEGAALVASCKDAEELP